MEVNMDDEKKPERKDVTIDVPEINIKISTKDS